MYEAADGKAKRIKAQKTPPKEDRRKNNRKKPTHADALLVLYT